MRGPRRSNGELTKQAYPSGALVTYVYDDVGSRTRMLDGSGITTYTYNAARMLRTVTVGGRGPLTYVYDDAGRVTRLEDYDGGRNTYTYDAVDRLTSLLNPLSERTTWVYDAVGRIVTLTYATGAYTTQTYNAVGWTTQVAHRKSDGSVLETFDYTYDQVGNRLTRGTTDYTYDAANQLTLRDAAGALITMIPPSREWRSSAPLAPGGRTGGLGPPAGRPVPTTGAADGRSPLAGQRQPAHTST